MSALSIFAEDNEPGDRPVLELHHQAARDEDGPPPVLLRLPELASQVTQVVDPKIESARRTSRVYWSLVFVGALVAIGLNLPGRQQPEPQPEEAPAWVAPAATAPPTTVPHTTAPAAMPAGSPAQELPLSDAASTDAPAWPAETQQTAQAQQSVQMQTAPDQNPPRIEPTATPIMPGEPLPMATLPGAPQ